MYVVAKSAIKLMEKRLYDFVASDMDSTLLNSEHVCSEYTKQTLCALTQQLHIPLILATGRTYADVRVVNRNLQDYFGQHSTATSGTPSYVVTCNGAEVHDAANGSIISAHYIAPSLVKELYTLLPVTETRINSNFFQGDRWYCRYDWNEMLQFHKESGLRYTLLDHRALQSDVNTRDYNNTKSGRELTESTKADNLSPLAETDVHVSKCDVKNNACNQVSNIIDVCSGNTVNNLENVSEFFYTSWDKPLLTKLETLLHTKYDSVLTIVFSSSYAINVTAKGVDKASGLRQAFHSMPAQPFELKRNSKWYDYPSNMSDVEREVFVDDRMRRTVAFGDDLNDARMLTSVGKGCIVGNANPALMKLHPDLEVIKTNVEHGPAAKLRELFNLKLEEGFADILH